MVRRKTKTQLPEVRFASVLKAFLCCLLIGGVAVGYVRQTHQNSVLWIELHRLNDEITKRAQQNDSLNERLLGLQSPHTLDDLARHLNLDLRPPRPEQVIELEMPGSGGPLIAQADERARSGGGKSP